MADPQIAELEKAFRQERSVENLLALVGANRRAGRASEAGTLVAQNVDLLTDDDLWRLALEGFGEEEWRSVLRAAGLSEATSLEDWVRVRGAHPPGTWDPGFNRRFRDLIGAVEACPHERRRILREFLATPHSSLDQWRGVIEAELRQRPWIVTRYPAQTRGIPPSAQRHLEVHRRGAGEAAELVVRDAQGVERHRFPIGDDFDPARIAAEIAEDVPRPWRGHVRRWLLRGIGVLGIFTVLFSMVVAIWRMSDPATTETYIARLLNEIRRRHPDEVGAGLYEWVVAFYDLGGDPSLLGVGWFASAEIWRKMAPRLAGMPLRERHDFASGLEGSVRRMFPPPVAEPPAPPAPPVTRRGRYYGPPAPRAPEPPPPPPRPALFPELTRGEILWRIRQEERGLGEDEAELAKQRGRLRWWRLPQSAGSPHRDAAIAELEARIARLRERIARRRARLDEFGRALDDPHRERGRITEFPPLPVPEAASPLDVEEKAELRERISALDRRIDELVRELARLKPHEHSARRRLEEWLDAAERERADREAELDALHRTRAEEAEEAARARAAAAKRAAEEAAGSAALRLAAAEPFTPASFNPALDLLASMAEFRHAYRLGIDVTRLAHRHGLAMQLPLDAQAGQAGPAAVARAASAVARDLDHAIAASRGTRAGGALRLVEWEGAVGRLRSLEERRGR